MNYKKGVGVCILLLMIGFSVANIVTGSLTLQHMLKPIGVYLIIEGILALVLIAMIAFQVTRDVVQKSDIVMNTVLVVIFVAWLIYGTTLYDLDCPRAVCRYFRSQILMQYIFLFLVCIWLLLGQLLGDDIWYIREFNDLHFVDIYLQYVTFMVCAATGFPLADIIVGFKFRTQCSKEPMIPIFLVCLGLTTLLLEGVLFLCMVFRRHRNKYLLFSAGILTLYIYSWIIAGTYWYGHSAAVESVHVSCNNTLYSYFVSQLILVYMSVCLLGFALALYIQAGVNIFLRCFEWIPTRGEADDEEERFIRPEDNYQHPEPIDHQFEYPEHVHYDQVAYPPPQQQVYYDQDAHQQQQRRVSAVSNSREQNCAICFETRRYFYILPCMHRVCRHCGEQILNAEDQQPLCPFCRRPFDITMINDVAEI